MFSIQKIVLFFSTIFFFCSYNFSIPLKDYLIGNFNALQNKNFSLVPAEYSIINRKSYILKTVSKQFEKMALAAKKENVDLYILSGFRSFQKQKNIWEYKFRSKKYASFKNERARIKKILEYSAAPGSSRHHWGTDIDIVFAKDMFSLKNSLYEKGKGKKAYDWLNKNAKKYGFCQPYLSHINKRNSFNIKNGFLEEKWHWSYFPIAKNLYQQYIKNYTSMKIPKFLGGTIAKQYILDYVRNIHTNCL